MIIFDGVLLSSDVVSVQKEMMFLYNTSQHKELLVVCRFPSFPSSEVVAFVLLSMVVTAKGRKTKTYQKNYSAHHNYSITKSALQWTIIRSNILLLRTESAKGFQAQLFEMCR